MTPSAPGRYPAISDYGIIGDSRTCALVSRDGSIDWFCAPNFDGQSIFGRILDWERGGFFQIAPAVPYTTRRCYDGETNVLETTFTTGDGEVTLTDFMPALREDEKTHAMQPLRSIMRFVEGRGGRVPMRLRYSPRPDYGHDEVRFHSHSPRDVTSSRGKHVLHLRSEAPLDVRAKDVEADFDVATGERLRFSLAYSEGEPAIIVSDEYVDWTYERTLAFWRDWSARCTYDGRHRASVIRSALTLKLLSYAPSGAIVAAATTSLPEEMGGVRNWDYRYCWLRDASFTVDVLLALGLENEARAFTYWLLHATRQTAPTLRPMYTLMGEPHIPEREIGRLEGYRGSRPVRVGNAASHQHQFDVYGELMAALRTYAMTDRPFDRDEGTFVRRLADHVAKRWRDPDSGIWEPRRPPQHYTHSKVMAWKALTDAASLARAGMIDGDADVWDGEATLISDMVLGHGYNEKLGAFTQVLDGDALDASLLMLPLVGFLPADDPRILSTIDAIQRTLATDGFLRRYEGDDGVGGGEGAFVICNFWLAAALAEAGRVDEALEVFDTTRRAENDLLIMSEQIDPVSGAALGNVPQAFSHIGLIEAALTIDRAHRRTDSTSTTAAR
jgi:GH15 family glucan-1,4-alpha-glucosidase